MVDTESVRVRPSGFDVGSCPVEMPSQPLPPVVEEETSELRNVRRRLLENPESNGASESEVVLDLLRIRDEINSAKEEDKGALFQQAEQLNYLYEQIRRGKQAEKVDPDSPYFGHLRLKEDGRTRDVFLGKATQLEHGLRIVDWRNAPISRLFYQYKEGDEYMEELADTVREGTIEVRRTVHIARGELRRVGTPDGTWVHDDGNGWGFTSTEARKLAGGEGQALLAGRQQDARLGSGGKHRPDKHLPDIAALIDPEQFQVITAPDAGVVVLRGSAGSGKTTVALHRIAYLCFAAPHRYQPQRILVMVWGKALRDYVAHVLPALGVEGVDVTTWSEWSRSAVRRHFPGLPGSVSESTPEPVTRVKVHPAIAAAIESRIRMSPTLPQTWEQAIDDWATVISDRALLREILPASEVTDGALDRHVNWVSRQQHVLNNWIEGEKASDDDTPELDAEDDALLLRAYQLRVGPLISKKKKPFRFAHLVLDEVQDFSPVEVQVLLDACDPDRSVTLAGDVRQHISEAAGFVSWTDFLERIGVPSTALSTLEVSYRSTHPITSFAVDLLQSDDEPVPRTTRDGPPVELFRFSDHGAAVAFLAEELKRLLMLEPLANVALLTPEPGLSRTYFEGLHNAQVPRLRLVQNQQFAFAPGIDVVEAAQVKGLEFDYVVIIEASRSFWPDTPHHRRLLHVAATRAIHQLWLTSVGEPSSILPRVREG